ncbi:MAG: hypothetical protein QXF01_02640 [Candidatus Micrarchaeaceae archaeon]
MNLSQTALEIIKSGQAKIRVLRSGMFQQMTFKIRRVSHGNIKYVQLYTDRMIDLSELSRISNEIGLPVEAQNGSAFPKGTSASDFQNL